MNRWFYFNLMLLLFATWKVLTGAFGLHIIMGTIGFLLVLFNWTRHAVFATIRESSDRTKKIKYANISKRALPFHKWTGSLGLLFILIHGSLVIQQFGFHLVNKKIATGLIAAIALFSLVVSGWIRWLKTTVVKRYVHLALGFTVFFLIIIHLLL